MCPAGLGCDDPRETVSTGAELRSKPGTAPAILAEVLRVLIGDVLRRYTERPSPKSFS